MKEIIIIRATSGAGKSTFAELLCQNIGWVYVEADKYFEDKDGNYNFDASKLHAAHKSCQDAFMEAMNEATVKVIVVSNTNTKSSDYKFYVDKAREKGYKVTYLVLEKRHEGKNVHGVPESVLENQEKNIRHSLKLS
jgi:uridine kinase